MVCRTVLTGWIRRAREHWQPLVDAALTGANALLFALSGTAVAAPLAIVQIAPLLLRRRWPAAVLIVVTAATAAHTTLGMARAVGFFPATIALYTAATHGSRTVRWLLCPAAGLVVAAASAVEHGPVEGLLMAIVTVTVAWLAGVERGQAIRLRLERQAARDRAEAAEQRERLARRVHDTLAHTVTVMLVQTEALRATTPLDDAGQRRVTSVLEAGRSALAEVRAALADADSPPAPLTARLTELTAAGLRIDGAPPDLDGIGTARDVAERLIGEAATNALRHDGPGARLTITTVRADGALRLCLTSSPADFRRGHPPRAAAGFGLRSLTEDITRYGGQLTHGPLSPSGWRVEARFPLV